MSADSEKLITLNPFKNEVTFDVDGDPDARQHRAVNYTVQFGIAEPLARLAVLGAGEHSAAEIAEPLVLTPGAVAAKLSTSVDRTLPPGYLTVRRRKIDGEPTATAVIPADFAIATAVPTAEERNGRIFRLMQSGAAIRKQLEEKKPDNYDIAYVAPLGYRDRLTMRLDTQDFLIPLQNPYGNIAARMLGFLASHPGGRFSERELFTRTMQALTVSERTLNGRYTWDNKHNSGSSAPDRMFRDVFSIVAPVLVRHKGIVLSRSAKESTIEVADTFSPRLSFDRTAVEKTAIVMFDIVATSDNQPRPEEARPIFRPPSHRRTRMPKTIMERSDRPQPLELSDEQYVLITDVLTSGIQGRTQVDAVALLDVIMDPAYDEALIRHMRSDVSGRRTLTGWKNAIHVAVRSKLGQEAYDEAVSARTIAAGSWHGRNRSTFIRQTGGAVDHSRTRRVERGEPREAVNE
ncbi:MAG: hypothetical protein JWM37_316 [Candidatus Saccharibacteria bacterium]|nr:hypothetical protein [Candidatus Saccharibacteria bacterium]